MSAKYLLILVSALGLCVACSSSSSAGNGNDGSDLSSAGGAAGATGAAGGGGAAAGMAGAAAGGMAAAGAAGNTASAGSAGSGGGDAWPLPPGGGPRCVDANGNPVTVGGYEKVVNTTCCVLVGEYCVNDPVYIYTWYCRAGLQEEVIPPVPEDCGTGASLVGASGTVFCCKV